MSTTAPPALPFDIAGIRLDGPGPLARQLVEQLRQRMLQGRLPAGARLPTTRELAAALGLSRNTVVRAYEHLLDEGLIQSRVGDGSYVTPPLAQVRPTGPAPGTYAASEPDAALPQTPRWQALQHFTPSRTPAGPLRAFRWGSPAMDLFPAALWSRLQAQAWRRHDTRDLAYGDPAGLPALREWLADYLRGARGLACSADQILITGGAQQGIALAAMALLGPGDEAAMESPGYRSAAAALALQAARVHPVPVDAEGLRPGALRALGARCRLLYVTPSHQFPTGV
ncbi:MAG TPA: PLP-dependent aminotransferase family protein, partial [Burkholderiaceae bacterium]|nr:PLP-dependent aminotransferase family protein [Burkholderiaceae bacterium]